MNRSRIIAHVGCAAILLAMPALVEAVPTKENVQVNLVSDVMGVALHTDANLVNPWGIAFAPTGPFWDCGQPQRCVHSL